MPSGVIHALAMTGAASWIKNEFATLGNHPESFMFFHNWTDRVVQNVRCENCHAIKLSGCLFWQDRSNRLWSKKRKMALNFWSVTGLSQFNSLPAKGFREKILPNLWNTRLHLKQAKWVYIVSLPWQICPYSITWITWALCIQWENY